MKRIGILTFHRAINYGAYLQSFSLQQYLSKQFPDCQVEIVDYLPAKEKTKIYRNVLGTLKRKGFRNALYEWKKVRMFADSMKEQVCSPMKLFRDNFEKLFGYMEERYDLIVVGSDAVLNWNQNGFPSAFFLDYDFPFPVVMYAASAHGLRYSEISPEQRDYCARCFGRFAVMAVRDHNTEEFIRSCNPACHPFHVCDPTFLIDREKVVTLAGEVDKRVSERYGFDMTQPYVVTMVLNEQVTERIRALFGDEYRIVTLFKPSKHADVFLYDLNPFEWVIVLSRAALVITQYFHGALLSMRFGTSTMVVDASGYEDAYESKLKDLMVTRLLLPERYISQNELLNDGEDFWTTAKNLASIDEGEYILSRMDHEAQTAGCFLDAVRPLMVQ